METFLNYNPDYIAVRSVNNDERCHNCHAVTRPTSYIMGTGQVLCYQCFMIKYPPTLRYTKRGEQSIFSVDFHVYEPTIIPKLKKCGWVLRELIEQKTTTCTITTIFLQYFGFKSCPRCFEINFPRKGWVPCNDLYCSSIVFDPGAYDGDAVAMASCFDI